MQWPARVTTPAILILPVHRDAHGVYVLYCEAAGQPGLWVEAQAQFFLRDQVANALRVQFGTSCQYVPQADFFMQGELRGESVSIVIVSVDGTVSKLQTGGFRNFAQVLSALRKDRDRLIYLKAWQFLAGMAEVKVKVTPVRP